MPENLNNSPARLEENEQYLRDPTSPSGKPYSTEQKAANERHKHRETLYHVTEGRRVFDKSEVEAAKKEGWRDVPFVHPRHPNKKIDVPRETSQENAQEVDEELEILRTEATEMGLKVDKRWSKQRLKDEILKEAS